MKQGMVELNQLEVRSDPVNIPPALPRFYLAFEFLFVMRADHINQFELALSCCRGCYFKMFVQFQ